MNTSGDRLRVLLRECHLSATDFAANRKVTPQHVNNWFKRGIPLARLEEVAELLCVTPRWLRTGDGPKHPGDHPQGHSGEAAPADNAPLTLGCDVELTVYREHTDNSGRPAGIRACDRRVHLSRHALQAMGVEEKHAICITLYGNSMADVIQDGSLVGIDRSSTQVTDGEMYAVEHGGMLRVKYLYRLPGGGLRLRSHNSIEYPDERLEAAQIEEQKLKILGWVFWWSTLNKRRPPSSVG